MLRRLGLVAWWLGASVIALGVMIVIAVIALDGDVRNTIIVSAVVVPLITALLWALAFVLTGSFWRPPKL
jgi:hypothetical protein